MHISCTWKLYMSHIHRKKYLRIFVVIKCWWVINDTLHASQMLTTMHMITVQKEMIQLLYFAIWKTLAMNDGNNCSLHFKNGNTTKQLKYVCGKAENAISNDMPIKIKFYIFFNCLLYLIPWNYVRFLTILRNIFSLEKMHIIQLGLDSRWSREAKICILKVKWEN